MATYKVFSATIALLAISKVALSGMMLEPINRASLWRVDASQPSNYHDDEYFCGNIVVQFQLNNGSCGVCGDDFNDPQPRSNENTGTYGNGVIVKTYKSGSVIRTVIKLTNSNLGKFTYSLCVLNDKSKPESEDCFENLKLVDGSDEYIVSANEYIVTNQVRLPAGIACERCVLRWQYTSNYSWGVCVRSTGFGCDSRETFRSCADIAII